MKKSELQDKLNNLGVYYKKCDTIATLTEKIDTAKKQICDAIEHHEKYSKSYIWTGDNGNAQQRAYREQQLSFIVKVSDKIEYESYVSISRKNFYYKGIFIINDKKVTLREWKKLLKK